MFETRWHTLVATTAIAAALVAGAAPAQDVAPQDVASQVDALFAPWTEPGSPGLAVAVIKDGRIVYKQGFGLANLELEVPITPRTVFYLGSEGKQFTAMAILLLEKQGKLSVDDDVRKFIPEFPDYGTPITIRHLLHHTSGIRDYLNLMGLADLDLGHFHSDAGIIDLLARQKALNFTPGEEFLYSNSGYFLLAVVVERASGKPLREYAEEHIFGPLGMKSTHFHDDYTHLIKNRASSYMERDDGSLGNFITTFDRVGSGGVYSTVEDLFLWDQNFYHHQVGGAEVVARLHTQGVLTSGEVIDYAFGLVIGEVMGLRVVEHGGGLGGYRAFIGRIPELRFSVVILANSGAINPRDLAMRVGELFLGDELPPPPEAEPTAAEERAVVEVSPEELAAVTGLYFDPQAMLVRRIAVREGQLIYSRGPDAESVLAPLGDQRFVMLEVPVDVEVRFQRPRPDASPEMHVTVDGGDPTVFESVEPVAYTAEELGAFAGTYYSEELDLTVDLEVEEGVLVVRSKRSDDVPLRAVFADFFTPEEGAGIRFQRGEGGRVVGYSVTTGRVRGLQFTRRPSP